MSHARSVLVLLVFILSSTGLLAQSTRWTGAVDSRWVNAANWTAGVPTSAVDAVLPMAPRSAGILVDAFCRGLVIEAGSALDIGSGAALTLSGGADVAGRVTGAGLMRFVGAGTIAGPLTRVAIVGGDYTADGMLVASSFEQRGGSLLVRSATIDGPATFSVGAVTGPGLLDLNGNVTFDGADFGTPPDITFSGSQWSADAAFAPRSGTVTFDGAGPQTMTGPGALTFQDLRVLAATSVAATVVNLTIHAVDVGGRLHVNGDLHVLQDTVVQAGAEFLVGTGNHTFSGNLTNLGTMNAAGSSVFDRDSRVRGTVTLQSATVDTATGTVVIEGDATVTEALVHRAGTLQTDNPSSILRVGGTASFLGGTLARNLGGRIDIDGDVLINGTLGPTPPDIHCAGDWTAAASFHPTSGTIWLDGPGTTTLGGLAPEFLPMFNDIVIAHGTRQVPGGTTLGAVRGVIERDGTFVLGSGSGPSNIGRVNFQCFGLLSNGSLRIEPGTVLGLDSLSSIDVSPTGSIIIAGTAAQPVVILGLNGGGYRVNLGGYIEASNFTFQEMAAQGIRILATATIAAPPADFRGGVFAMGAAAPGAVLLDVAATQPVELRYLTFRNTPPTAQFNVRSTTNAPIRLVNADGEFAGPSFEDDPNNVIEWSQQHTGLGSFRALGSLQGLRLQAQTTSEIDAVAYHILRATSPGGPFVEIAGSPLPAQGGPGMGASYALPDLGLAYPTRFYYRLEEELTHGPRRLVSTATGRPWPQQAGATAFVGTGGFADIASAMAAVPPGGAVIVAAGTYPSFTIDRSVHILGDGSGPVVIDTATRPLRIENIATGADVALYDVQIGTSTMAAGLGLQLNFCRGTVVLDHVTVNSIVAGVDVRESRQVAIQACDLTGVPPLRVHTESWVWVAGGRMDEIVREDASRVTIAGLTPGRLSPGIVQLPGTMPFLLGDTFAGAGTVAHFRITGDPGAGWILMFAFGRSFNDLSRPLGLDMPFMLDPTLTLPLTGGGLDANGRADVRIPVPDLVDLVGNAVPFQGLVIDSPTHGRFATLRDLRIVP